jgi:YD repeat-containing protein
VVSFLTQAVNPLETFNYNPVGNRTNSNQNGASVFNTANQLLEDANFTYQYDNNGNMTRKTAKIGGAITQFEYDAENKLVRVVSPSNTANYKYDGLDRRVEKEVIAGSTTVTKYVYDNEDILLELDGSNNIVARYTHGPAIDEPLIMEKNSQPFYYHADGLGSVTELTNQSGTVAQRYTSPPSARSSRSWMRISSSRLRLLAGSSMRRQGCITTARDITSPMRDISSARIRSDSRVATLTSIVMCLPTQSI